jgi:hypothetical protein
MLGTRPTKPRSGSTAWRSSIELHQDQAVLEQANQRFDLGNVAKLKLEGRRQAKLHPRFAGGCRTGASLVGRFLTLGVSPKPPEDRREAERGGVERPRGGRWA